MGLRSTVLHGHQIKEFKRHPPYGLYVSVCCGRAMTRVLKGAQCSFSCGLAAASKRQGFSLSDSRAAFLWLEGEALMQPALVLLQLEGGEVLIWLAVMWLQLRVLGSLYRRLRHGCCMRGAHQFHCGSAVV